MNINPFFKSIDKKLTETLLQWDLITTLIETNPKTDVEWYIPMSFIDDNCIRILYYCIDSKSFEEIGELCVKANKVANYKYGENKAKLMEQIGIVTIDTSDSPHKVKTTSLGEHLLSLDIKEATSIMIRLSVGIPVIHYLISNADNNNVRISSVFSNDFKPSTIKRRSSSIVHLLKDIESEYNCKGFTKRLQTEAASQFSEENENSSVNDGLNSVMITNKTDSNETDDRMALKMIENDYGESLYHRCDRHIDELLIDHQIINNIDSFINEFYKIDVNTKIQFMFETITNIIEDPSSDYITQTLAYLPLGYFVKTARLTRDSMEENECACFISLLKIYELDMDLVVCNLSENFTLKDFYDMRETYNFRYGSIIESVSKSTGIEDFFKRASREITTDEYKAELEQLHRSESNLYYRLKNEGTSFLNEELYMRALQLVSQSRLEYPVNGIDDCYIPQLRCYDAKQTMSSEKSMMECISSAIGESSIKQLEMVWETTYIEWQDRVNELLMMAYVLSPHKIVMKGDIDVLYIICQSIIDKSRLFDDKIEVFANDLYDKYVKIIEDEDQIRILNRVNSIFISNYLEQNLISILTYIQDDIQWITRICIEADRNAGRNARYKSRFGIGSSLDIYEKTEVEKIFLSRLNTDTKRSRQNRYRNKIRYDYDEE